MLHPLEAQRIESETPVGEFDVLPQRKLVYGIAQELVAWWTVRLRDVHGIKNTGGLGNGPTQGEFALTAMPQRAAERAQTLAELLERYEMPLKNPLPQVDYEAYEDKEVALAAYELMHGFAGTLTKNALKDYIRDRAREMREARKKALYDAYARLHAQGGTYSAIAKMAGCKAAQVRYVLTQGPYAPPTPAGTTPTKKPTATTKARTAASPTAQERTAYLREIANAAGWVRNTPVLGSWEDDPVWEPYAEACEDLDTLRDARAWFAVQMRYEAFGLDYIAQVMGWEGTSNHFNRMWKRVKEVLEPAGYEPDDATLVALMSKYADVDEFATWLKNTDPDDVDTRAQNYVMVLSRLLKANPKWKHREAARKAYTAQRKQYRQDLDRAVLRAYDAGIPAADLAHVMGSDYKVTDVYNSVRRARTDSEEN